MKAPRPVASLVLLFLALPLWLALGSSRLSAQTLTLEDAENQESGFGVTRPTDTVDYSAQLSNTTGSPLTNIVFTNTGDLYLNYLAGSVAFTPVGGDDSYGPIVRNEQLVVAAPGVLSNDFAETSRVVSMVGTTVANTAPGTPVATTQGGTVTLNADGSFTYNPPAGSGTTDTFVYTVEHADGSPAGDGTNNLATVSITFTASTVWFVDNSASTNGNGTQGSPFDNIASAEVASSAGHIIYLHTGSSAYNETVNLQLDQSLIGAGVDLVVDSRTLETAGTRPVLRSSAGAGVLPVSNPAGDYAIRGLNIENTLGFAISLGFFNTLNITDVAITDCSGALNAGTGTLNATFDSIDTSGGAYGINLNRTGGTLTVNGFTYIENNTVGAIEILNAAFAPGGALTCTFDSVTTTGVGGIDLLLSNNASTQVTFGALNVTTANGAGLQAQNISLVLLSPSNTINATNGPALDLRSMTLGSHTFTSLTSANSSGRGVYLSGNAGGITVGGAVTVNNPGDDALRIENSIGTSAFVFQGPVTLNTGNGLGAGDAPFSFAANSTGTSATFSGGLDIDATTAQYGFYATGDGSITVASGPTNTINTSQARPLFLDGVNGGGGIDFDVVEGTSVNGRGIHLLNTVGNKTFGRVNVVTTTGEAFYASAAGTLRITDGSNNSVLTSGDDSGLEILNSVVGTFNVNSVSGTDILLSNVSQVDASSAIDITTGALNSPSSGNTFVVSGGNTGIHYGGSVTGAGGSLVAISGRNTNDLIELSGNLNGGASAGLAITSNTNAQMLFSGASKTLITGSAIGVNYTGNNGTTLSFTNGGLAITANAAIAINAEANTSASLAATGSGNEVITLTDPAIHINGTTIAAANITFERVITSTSVTEGIRLINTGTSGGLIVTGDGSTSGSGGSILASGDAVYLENAHNTSLAFMNLDAGESGIDITGGSNGLTLNNVAIGNTGFHGIDLDNGGGLDFDNVTMTGAGDADEEHGLALYDLFGTNTIDNSTIRGLEDVVDLQARNNGFTLLKFTGCTFSQNDYTNTFAENGITALFFENHQGKIVVVDSDFELIDGLAFLVATGQNSGSGVQTSSADVVFKRNAVKGDSSTTPQQMGAQLFLNAIGAGSMRFDISDNNPGVRTGAGFYEGVSLVLNIKNDSSGLMEGRIHNNFIQGPSTAFTGNLHSPLSIKADGNPGTGGSVYGTARVRVTDNTFDRTVSVGIAISAQDADPAGGFVTAEVELGHNVMTNYLGASSFYPGASISADGAGRLFIDTRTSAGFGNNDLNSSSFFLDWDVSTADTTRTIHLVGLTTLTKAGAEAFVAANNPGDTVEFDFWDGLFGNAAGTTPTWPSE